MKVSPRTRRLPSRNSSHLRTSPEGARHEHVDNLGDVNARKCTNQSSEQVDDVLYAGYIWPTMSTYASLRVIHGSPTRFRDVLHFDCMHLTAKLEHGIRDGCHFCGKCTGDRFSLDWEQECSVRCLSYRRGSGEQVQETKQKRSRKSGKLRGGQGSFSTSVSFPRHRRVLHPSPFTKPSFVHPSPIRRNSSSSLAVKELLHVLN